MGRRGKRSAPKSKIEKDWKREECLGRIKKLMNIRTQVFSPFPFLQREVPSLLYTKEQRAALAVVEAMDPEHMLSREQYATIDIKMPDGTTFHARVGFADRMFVTRYDHVKDHWFEEPVRAQIREWALKRKTFYAEECRAVVVVTNFLNLAGTYPQMNKLWPGLFTFMHEDMRAKIQSQRVTRVSDDMRFEWDQTLRDAKGDCTTIERWLTEALLVEHNEFENIQAY